MGWVMPSLRLIGYEYNLQPLYKRPAFIIWTNVGACLDSQGRWVIMPSMEVVEFFQDEVQFPYGVLPRATQKSISTSPS